jgi:hypothetical protein
MEPERKELGCKLRVVNEALPGWDPEPRFAQYVRERLRGNRGFASRGLQRRQSLPGKRPRLAAACNAALYCV